MFLSTTYLRFRILYVTSTPNVVLSSFYMKYKYLCGVLYARTFSHIENVQPTCRFARVFDPPGLSEKRTCDRVPPTPALPCSVPSLVLCKSYYVRTHEYDMSARVAPSLLSLLHPAPAVCAINCSTCLQYIFLRALKQRGKEPRARCCSRSRSFLLSSIALSAPKKAPSSSSFAPPLLVAEHSQVPTPPATPVCMQKTVGRCTPYLLMFCTKPS